MTQTPELQGREEKEPTTRLSMDIPKTLHVRVKSGCALESKTITEVVIELLEQRFGNIPAKENIDHV